MTQETRQQLSEQRRAASAWRQIQDVATHTDDNFKKQYGTLARRLPSMLQTNGLGQTLAFLSAKGENKPDKAHTYIFKHVSDWVKEQMGEKGTDDLLTWIINQESDAYRRATTESIVYAIWLRRFAEAQGWGDLEQEV